MFDEEKMKNRDKKQIKAHEMQLKEVQKRIKLKEKKLTYEKSAFEEINFHARSTA